MNRAGLPGQQGLYDPQFEHDACGIGVLVNINGEKSNNIVTGALTVLNNLDHRGARGDEENTGDGAGILIQIPHVFFEKKCKIESIDLPKVGSYAIGMLFLTPDKHKRIENKKVFEKVIKQEGLNLLGWRTVPTNSTMLGKAAKDFMPFMEQVFIEKSDDIKDETEFERKLYVVRRKVEKQIKDNCVPGHEYFYVSSLSASTIVYKGMLIPEQLGAFFVDLQDTDMVSALALVHSRFSTNTFPSWERAHPNRYMIHNGEINTLRGNVNGIRARQATFDTDKFGCDLKEIMPVIDEDGSDSSMFDNCLEFMALSGRKLEETMLMMIPEPWEKNPHMNEEKRNFYEYNSCLMEPWDGPAAIVFTDGKNVGAVLDRNGLRPARYYVTKDGMLVLASEVGVLDIPEENIACKKRLEPGKMLLVSTDEKRIISDEEIKKTVTSQNPYGEWINENMLTIDKLEKVDQEDHISKEEILQKQKVFGYTYEELRKIIEPMAKDGVDPLGAMGNDSPLAVLSDKPQLLYNYFKQLFAQVTNPPIDSIREEIVTGTRSYLGGMGNLLESSPEACRQIAINTPFLYNESLAKIKYGNIGGFKTKVIPMLFEAVKGERGLVKGLKKIFREADKAIESGVNIIILSDRDNDDKKAPIPALIAVSGLHHYLIEKGTRTKTSIILESGEPREVHHFAALLGYGVDAINPYLAIETIVDMIENGQMEDTDAEKAVYKYMKASVKGVVKVLSKMGISTIQSYRGAQIFEAVGISRPVIDKYFTRTASRVGGIGMDIIAKEALMRHKQAYESVEDSLETGGVFQWREDGEYHLVNPETIVKLQEACRESNYNVFKDYCDSINKNAEQQCTLRGLLEFRYAPKPLPIEEVESVESICRRFKTGAMSYGSLGLEAHECMAIAMNRIGGKSNSGEGGELAERFIPEENGDSKCSKIKQVASGRFGVTSHYLVNAEEIQLKLAQGAKPGEGGQLPGRKVYPWIAEVRNSTPGVGLISPPPHHDIYSIEDLAELIHDLKSANPSAKINVKLVSEVGVGTIAAGVAKGLADIILISGYDGGTGAAPRTSTRHTGLPWELGLAETNQTLVLNKLRNRVKLEVDGKLMTGRDIAVAALLGAEEFGFATLPLVTMGCIMMRVCNLDTCPVGIATQNKDLRKNFQGKPEHIENFMRYMAQNLREEMSKLGVKTIDEMIGRSDLLKTNESITHWKAKFVDLGSILYQPRALNDTCRYNTVKQDHKLEKSLDMQMLVEICKPAIFDDKKVEANIKISNTDRVVGTIVGSMISKEHGKCGLKEDAITLNFKGSAGQSFGAFIPSGMTLKLEGDANDYMGKGLSGGKIIVYPSAKSDFETTDNIIIGNVAFYGATQGEVYINGRAGERFCVRNSGIIAVVEGVGDHGCEYMTGGKVVVLGGTGRNFGAGMSGGVAYILDENNDFEKICNKQMADIELVETESEIKELKEIIEKHKFYTNSQKASIILDDFESYRSKFKKVVPRDYKRVILAIEEAKKSGLSDYDARMYAFEQNKNDASRVSGN